MESLHFKRKVGVGDSANRSNLHVFHQGFVFINANIILVLLLYKAITRKEKRKKYIALFIGFFSLFPHSSAISEFFSHVNGTRLRMRLQRMPRDQTVVRGWGEANETIVRHEILGEDVFQDEMKYHIYNYKDFPVFLLLFAPYIVIRLHFFIRLFRTTESWNRLMYLIIFVGAGTILPQMIFVQRWITQEDICSLLDILLLYSCCHGALCDGGYSNRCTAGEHEMCN